MSFLHSWGHTATDSPCGEPTAADTPIEAFLDSVHGNTDPGVSTSLAASHVMKVGEISHTFARRSSSSSEAEEAPTPCSLWAETHPGAPVHTGLFIYFYSLLLVTFCGIVLITSADRIVLDHHGRENLRRVALNDAGTHAGGRDDPSGGGPGEAGGAGAGAVWR